MTAAALILALLAPAAAAAHPLDPLGPAELAKAVALVKADKRFPAGSLFPLVAFRARSPEASLPE